MKKHFLTGLAILLPVVVTIALVVFLINLLTKPFVGIVSSLLSQFPLLDRNFFFLSKADLILYTSKCLILIFLFFLTVGLGILARWLFTHTLLKLFDQVLDRIPLVNTVYKTTKEIIKTLFSDKNPFNQVVIVPFPHEKSFVLGLIAGEAPTVCKKALDESLVSVFVPTTPNPTNGFLFLFKRSEIIEISMPPEDAIKYIVSCGMINPEKGK